MVSAVLWRWSALDRNGDYQQGYMLLRKQHDAMQQLTERNFTPVSLCRVKTYQPRHWLWPHKITFIRQLATLIKTGLTLTDSLKLLAEGKQEPGWKALFTELQLEVEKGLPFSSALRLWPEIFPPLFAALVQSGEMTGRLEESCLQLAKQQEYQQQLRKKVIKALRYPLFILLIASLVMTGMISFVLPEFIKIYDAYQAPLPFFTRVIITFSHWCQYLILPVGILIISSLVIRQRQMKSSTRWQYIEQHLLLCIPFVSRLHQGHLLTQIYTTLALTQQAGLPLLHGLEVTANTLEQPLWHDTIMDLQSHIARGLPLFQAIMQHKIFTPLCYQLIRTGEESGSLDIMLSRLAEWHAENTHNLVDSLIATIEPLMMTILGIIVGGLVIAMYLPLFSLGDVLY